MLTHGIMSDKIIAVNSKSSLVECETADWTMTMVNIFTRITKLSNVRGTV